MRRVLWGLVWAVVVGLWACMATKVAMREQVFAAVVLSVATPYLYLPAWGVSIAAVVGRRWWLTGAAGALALAHAWTLHPMGWIPTDRGDGPADLRVMNANVLYANEHTDAMVAEIVKENPHILLVQELTPHWQQAFSSPEMMERFPYRKEVVREDAFGIGTYSQRPLEEVSVETMDRIPWIRARLKVQHETIEIWNIHTMPPRDPQATQRWHRMMAELVEMVDQHRGVLVLGGDFNTTPHVEWYSHLTNRRLTAAHDACGRGWATTWPNGRRSLPPIRLDHVFYSWDLTCVSVREGEGIGSDHRPVIADLAFREQRFD